MMTVVRAQTEDRIRELYKMHGTITPDIVIEDAKDPESPLHDEFNWDLEAAAMDAWRDKARHLIRSVRVVVTTESKTFKAQGYKAPEFIRDPSASSFLQGYVRVYEIRSDVDRARAALVYEIERINGALTRARALCLELGLQTEFNIVEDAVKAFRKKAGAA